MEKAIAVSGAELNRITRNRYVARFDLGRDTEEVCFDTPRNVGNSTLPHWAVAAAKMHPNVAVRGVSEYNLIDVMSVYSGCPCWEGGDTVRRPKGGTLGVRLVLPG